MCERNSIVEFVSKYSQLKVSVEAGVIKFHKDPPDILKDIENDVEGCPVCALTILRCVYGKSGYLWCFDYDFKGKLAQWWKDVDAYADRHY